MSPNQSESAQKGLAWGELILTALTIFAFVGVGFIPGSQDAAFFNRFWFMWLCFAAFVGITPLLALHTRCLGALWHIGTSTYILLCVGLCFHDQHFFASGGIENLLWSSPVVIGLFIAESRNKHFPVYLRIYAIPVTLAVLTVSVISTFASPAQLFLPLLFVPNANLESAHSLFFGVFMTAALLSFSGCLFVSTIARRAQQGRATLGRGSSCISRVQRFFDSTIPFKKKFQMTAGVVACLLVALIVAFYILETSSGSGTIGGPGLRNRQHDDLKQLESADEIIAYLRRSGYIENKKRSLVASETSTGGDRIAEFDYPLSNRHSLQLEVCRAKEETRRILINYSYGKVSANEARLAQVKIKEIREAFLRPGASDTVIPKEPANPKENVDTSLSIREVLRIVKTELQVRPEYLPAVASNLYKEPSVRKLRAVLGFYRTGNWSSKQRDRINFILTRIIYGLPVPELLKNIAEIEKSHSAEAQNACIRRIADSHPSPPPLAIYVYFLKNSRDVSVQYGAMYALSESHLNDAPSLPDYSKFLEEPSHVVADWEDYLSAHLIAGLQSMKAENPDELYELELTCARRSIQIGEKTQIGLFIRGTTRPRAVENALSKAQQPSEWGSKVPFSTNTEYEPKTTGIKTIGPFEIDFQGKHLKSNSVLVEVTDRWPENEERQEVRLFPRKVIVGTPIRAIYRQQYSARSPLTSERKNTMHLDSNQWLPGSKSTWEKDGQLFHKEEWWFEVPTCKAGKMTITKADLPGLPSGVLVEPAEIEAVEVLIPEERIAQEVCGIGAAVEKENGICAITQLFDGYGAIAAGLKEGDIITHIDTKDISASDVHQIRTCLHGQKDTKVVLTIQRRGETSPKEYTVVRRLVNEKR